MRDVWLLGDTGVLPVELGHGFSEDGCPRISTCLLCLPPWFNLLIIFDSTSISARLFLPPVSFSTLPLPLLYSFSLLSQRGAMAPLGSQRGASLLEPKAAQIEKPSRVVPKAGSKRVAKGRRPKGRGCRSSPCEAWPG